MKRREALINRMFYTEMDSFEALAIDVFEYQRDNNELYGKFVEGLKGKDFRPKSIHDIPFLPISFFKTHEVTTGVFTAENIYKSSATTGMTRSKHFVKDNGMYLDLALKAFESFYGSMEDYVFFALLPGYVERGDSSLVSMASYFIEKSKNVKSGFYLDNLEDLKDEISEVKRKGQKSILLGVSFALWELATQNVDLDGVIVMETGGMKGKGPELPKAAFHELLRKGLNVNQIHSEYGMTELLSQAYSTGDTIFQCSKSMKVLITDITDPLSYMTDGKAGIINVIDLANIDSCSFICTEDLGVRMVDDAFRILGRVDAAEIRGCNLLVSDL